MKSIFLLLLLTALYSCSDSISKYELIGSWIETTEGPVEDHGTAESLVFQADNIARLVLKKDGKIVSSKSFTYEVDEENKLLITEWDNIPMSSKIVTLNKTQLVLKRASTNTTLRYKRMDEN